MSIRLIIIIVTFVTAILFIVCTIWVMYILELPDDDGLRLEYLKFVLELYKVIGIGFLVTLLGTLIPNILPEAKYKFDKLKEGREIFSKAKTGIDYLPFRLAELGFRESFEHIERIHEVKHLADTYIKDMPQIGKWPYDPYEKITVVRNLVLSKSKDWDKMSRESKLEIFQQQ